MNYDVLSEQLDLPIFYQPWYLDAVCAGGEWAVAMDETDDSLGVWPYYLKRKLGLPYMTLPPLSPYLGPYIYVKPEFTPAGLQAIREIAIGRLGRQLPWCTHRVFSSIPNTTQIYTVADTNIIKRRTYLIAAEQAAQYEVKDLKQRNNIKSAREALTVVKSEDVLTLYILAARVFQKQAQVIPFSQSFFLNYDKELKSRHARSIYLAHDHEQSAVAGVYVIHDQYHTYYIISGRVDGAHRGAVALLLSEAISDALSAGRIFDFEGSMIPGINRFFKSFGGKEAIYDQYISYSNPFIKSMLHLLKKI